MPSILAVAEVTSVFVPSYKLTVTGLLAITCPVRVAVVGTGVEVGVADSTGVEVNVGVGDSTGVEVNVAVGVSVGVTDSTGVDVKVGVGDSTGVEVNVAVGDSTGVGVKVGVAPLPATVRLVPVEVIWVRILSPFETRAVHSIAVCPACKPVTLKVNTAPLVVALLPLLPAIATMKLPFWGPLIAMAGSAPNRLAAAILLTPITLGL